MIGEFTFKVTIDSPGHTIAILFPGCFVDPLFIVLYPPVFFCMFSCLLVSVCFDFIMFFGGITTASFLVFP